MIDNLLHEPVGVLLAGGKSRRMGRDKALLMLDGLTLLERALSALQGAYAEVALSLSTTERADYLRSCLPHLCSLPLLVDAWPDTGPLGALATAQRAYPGRAIVLVAVDMPFLEAHILRKLYDVAGDAAIVLPLLEGRVEPLHAFYGPATAPLVVAQLFSGELAMHKLIAAVEAQGLAVRYLDDLAPRALTNLNTPADLTTLGAKAGQ